MTYSPAQKRASAKYNAKAYDRVELKVKKGRKEELQEHASRKNESLNSFINRAIDETIARDNADATSTPIVEQNEQNTQEEEHIILPWEDSAAEQKDKRPKTIEDLIQLQKQFAMKKEQEPEEEHIPLPWEE